MTRIHPLVRRPRRVLPAVVAVSGLILVAIVVWHQVSFEFRIPALRIWVESQGALGMVGFGAAYAVSALLFVPGAALTLLAGGVFGIVWGMVVVSIASSVADGAAFLIGRYIARDAVEHLARRYRRFGAIDAAIHPGGMAGRRAFEVVAHRSIQREQLFVRPDGHPLSPVLGDDLGVHAAPGRWPTSISDTLAPKHWGVTAGPASNGRS